MTALTAGRTITLALGAALAATVAIPAFAEDKELTIFDWSGYEDPAFYHKYVAKHGDSPLFTFFGDADQAFDMLRYG